MSYRESAHDQEVAGSDSLHQLAQQKVQAALAGLRATVPTAEADSADHGQPELPQPETPDHDPDPDPDVRQAVERLHSELSEVTALDRWGHPVTLAELARIVLGPPESPPQSPLDSPSETPSRTSPSVDLRPVPPAAFPEHVRNSHVTLENGVERYVFRAADESIRSREHRYVHPSDRARPHTSWGQREPAPDATPEHPPHDR